MAKSTVGTLLRGARTAHDLSLQEVAQRAGCSAGYVHKLESDAVKTPSPRVLAGLAEALGLAYGDLMQAAGYAQRDTRAPERPGAITRYSNAHIVQLLEQLQREVGEIRSLLSAT